jgi:hypothetical protein
MYTATIRYLHALLVALVLLTAATPLVSAQSAAPLDNIPVRLQMQDGWSGSGRLNRADDFVIVCPTDEVLDLRHPCSTDSAASSRPAAADNFALVCPVKEVLDSNHPCFARMAQIQHRTPDDFVLVCPTLEVSRPSAPPPSRCRATMC